jgi:hypothetical protein
MPCSLRSFISGPLITVLLLLLTQPGHNAATARFNPRAHIERGDQVESRYTSYSKRLARHHAALITAVKQHAPDLIVHLQPRQPLLYGYRVLPEIVAEADPEKRSHAGLMAYSWPWTDRLIDAELELIARSEVELRRAAAGGELERRALLEKLTHDYGRQIRRLRNIYDHVEYNRLWQPAIAADRAGYDRETELLAQVVERQGIMRRLDRVHSGPAAAAAEAPLGVSELTYGLRKRQALLDRRIDRAIDQVQSPAFVRLQVIGRERIFHVPLFTDIEDARYVESIKKIIESTWQLRNAGSSYRVELHITHLPVEALYVHQAKPIAGHQIDLRTHLRQFPANGAILTTGARTTHVRNHAIVLGPHPLAPQVLAHEFGHILGFRDRYVRGYKDLGEHGLQVMEIVADPDDIMSATPHGVVQPWHFTQLLEGRSGSDPGAERRLISGK